MKIIKTQPRFEPGSRLILLPCYLYEIVVVKKRAGKNIIEELITRLIEIDPIFQNVNELAKILKLNQHGMNDLAVLTLALARVLDENRQEPREEQRVYQVYQERYGGSVLRYFPELDEGGLAFVEERAIFNVNEEIKRVKFEANNKDKEGNVRESDAYYLPPQEEVGSFSNNELLEAVGIYNQHANIKISIDAQLSIPSHREEVYIPCSVSLREGREFKVMSGLSYALSGHLESVLQRQANSLLKELRKQNIQSSESAEKSEFKKRYNDYRDDVLANLIQYGKSNKNYEKTRFLYNAFEKYFAFLNRKENYRLEKTSNADKKELETIAKGLGFEGKYDSFYNKSHLDFLYSDGQKNMRSYLITLIKNKHPKLHSIADDYPQFLVYLSELNEARNMLMHGNKDEKKTKGMDIKELNYLQSALLKMSSKDIQHISKNYEGPKEPKHNGIVQLEKEISDEIIGLMRESDVNDLAGVYEALETMSVSGMSVEGFGSVILGLSRTCESMLLRYLNLHIHKARELSEEKLKEKISMIKNKYQGLATVINKKVKDHIQKDAKADLRTYLLTYLLINEEEDPRTIEIILKLNAKRGHGNFGIDDLQKSTLKELKELKEELINCIQKIANSIK